MEEFCEYDQFYEKSAQVCELSSETGQDVGDAQNSANQNWDGPIQQMRTKPEWSKARCVIFRSRYMTGHIYDKNEMDIPIITYEDVAYTNDENDDYGIGTGVLHGVLITKNYPLDNFDIVYLSCLDFVLGKKFFAYLGVDHVKRTDKEVGELEEKLRTKIKKSATQIRILHNQLRTRYPHLRIIWTMPAPRDYTNVDLEFEGDFDINVHKAHISIMQYFTLLRMIRRWIKIMPTIPFVSVPDLVISKKDSASFLNTKGNLKWTEKLNASRIGLSYSRSLEAKIWKEIKNLYQLEENGIEAYLRNRHRPLTAMRRFNDRDKKGGTVRLQRVAFLESRKESLIKLGLNPKLFCCDEEFYYYWEQEGRAKNEEKLRNEQVDKGQRFNQSFKRQRMNDERGSFNYQSRHNQNFGQNNNYNRGDPNMNYRGPNHYGYRKQFPDNYNRQGYNPPNFYPQRPPLLNLPPMSSSEIGRPFGDFNHGSNVPPPPQNHPNRSSGSFNMDYNNAQRQNVLPTRHQNTFPGNQDYQSRFPFSPPADPRISGTGDGVHRQPFSTNISRKNVKAISAFSFSYITTLLNAQSYKGALREPLEILRDRALAMESQSRDLGTLLDDKNNVYLIEHCIEESRIMINMSRNMNNDECSRLESALQAFENIMDKVKNLNHGTSQIDDWGSMANMRTDNTLENQSSGNLLTNVPYETWVAGGISSRLDVAPGSLRDKISQGSKSMNATPSHMNPGSQGEWRYQ